MDQAVAAATDPAVFEFSRKLLMVPEHTWGLDDKSHLADYTHYSRDGFDAVRNTSPFLRMMESWDEQRGYIDGAVQALGPSNRKIEAERRLRSIRPSAVDIEGFEPVGAEQLAISNQFFTVALNPATGAINRCIDKRNQTVLADSQHNLGLLSYQSFSDDDYRRFLHQYVDEGLDWAPLDFGKPGLGSSGAVSEQTGFRILESFRRVEGETQTLVTRLSPTAQDERYDGPDDVHITLTLPGGAPEMSFDVQWFSKPQSRMPQACWLAFVPQSAPGEKWLLRKLGCLVSPDDVVPNGNRHLHAIQDYVERLSGPHVLRVTSMDAPLVAVGKPSLLDFTNDPPRMDGGVHFNLYNNVWGTNFPTWLGGAARFRFVLGVLESSTS
jgi:hypothetical protein